LIEYRYGNDLDLDQVRELYEASTLGERRPVDDRAVLVRPAWARNRRLKSSGDPDGGNPSPK